jgi:hypothetical protein
MAALNVYDAGGVTCPLTRERLDNCLATIEAYVEWYERIVLGCSSERWLAMSSVEDFENWLEESEDHQNSGAGLITRFGRSIGLQNLGKGASNLLSEESFVGLEIKDLENPVEAGHLVRSHDACLVCTVHFVQAGRRITYQT